MAAQTYSGVDGVGGSSALRAAVRLAVGFAVVKLAVQFVLTVWTSHLGYGYFRDEFYYIACGRHLAWGYVDHGPLVAVQARLSEMLFGESVFGLRVLSALAGAATVLLGGLVCWAMGGRRPAQALTMFALLLTPQYLGTDGFLSMNSFEPVFWTVCVLAVAMLLRGASQRVWWSVFGVSAGLGLLNKPSLAFFLVSVGVGLLATRQRRVLLTRWGALGVLLLVVIALPNVLWQMHNGWPMLEFLHNGQAGGKSVTLGPVRFFLAQVLTLQPVNALLWVAGVVALLRAKSVREGRWLGLAYVLFFAVMFALHAKDYYLEGVYPAIFAAGGIAWERRWAASRGVREGRVFAFPVFQTVLLVTTLVVLPLCSPVLRPAAWVRYTGALHLHGDRQETDETGPLPQFFADRFGWEQEVDLVQRAFNTLTPEERRRVCLFGSNYGEAGAIDFLGRLRGAGFPPAISGQNNYWLWGTHGCDTNVVIAVVRDTPEQAGKKFSAVTVVGRMDDPYAMPFEHRTVYLLRGRRPSAPFDWRDERYFY